MLIKVCDNCGSHTIFIERLINNPGKWVLNIFGTGVYPVHACSKECAEVIDEKERQTTETERKSKAGDTITP